MNELQKFLISAAVLLWAVFATYQWVSASAKTDTLIEAALNEASLKAQNSAIEQAEKARTAGEAKTEEIKIVYKTVKDIVYKNRVVNKCPGVFPAELRMGLSSATSAANGDVPAATH